MLLLSTLLVLGAFAGAEGGNPEHVFFAQRGKTAAFSGYVHVAVSLDLTQIKNNIDVITRFVVHLQEKGEGTNQGRPVLIRHLDELAKLDLQLQSYAEMGDPLEGERSRRFLDLLLGIGNTILGLYNQYEIQELKGQVVAQADAITDIFHELDAQQVTLGEHGLRIATLEETAKLTWIELTDLAQYFNAVELVGSLVEAVRMQVDNVGAVFDALMVQRLSVKSVTKGAMAGMLKQAKVDAAKKGYEVLPTNAAEAHQCPCSFASAGLKVTAFLHLPLAKKEDMMTVYEYLSVPVVVSKEVHMTVFPENAIIAINDARTEFITMTLTKLAACTKMGAVYVCPDNGSKHKAARVAEFDGDLDTDLCTFFLLTGEQEQISKACAVHVHAPKSKRYELSGTEYVVVEKEDRQGTLTCHGKGSEWIQLNGATRVTVPPGCQFETSTGISRGSLNLALNVTPVAFAWSVDPVSLLQGLNLESYEDMVVRAKENVAKTRVPRDIRDVHDYINGRDRWNSHSNLTYSNVVLWTVLVTVIVAAGVLGCCWWYRCRGTKRDRGTPQEAVAAYTVPAASAPHVELFYNQDQPKALSIREYLKQELYQ